MAQLSILGAGSWGTALASVLAPRFEQIRIWAHEPETAAQINDTGENLTYLPGYLLPRNIEAMVEIEEALSGADVVLGVMPSHHARAVWSQAAPYVDPAMLLVSATKGLETNSLLRVSEVIEEAVRPQFSPKIAVLSGPTFAREIAAGDPAAVAIASNDQALAGLVQGLFSGPSFRLYTNSDPTGVEVGAALKNCIAIAAGIAHGLGLGHNTTAALITRGLVEITRLAVALGGQPATLSGLAGLGDLVLTCTGDLSRNRHVGVELSKGRKIGEIVDSMKMVAEGVQTTLAAVDLARREKVELPIIEQMNAIFTGGADPRDSVRSLMERSLKGE